MSTSLSKIESFFGFINALMNLIIGSTLTWGTLSSHTPKNDSLIIVKQWYNNYLKLGDITEQEHIQ